MGAPVPADAGDSMDVDLPDPNDPAVKRKGRGFGGRGEAHDGVRGGTFESVAAQGTEERAARSIEGWIILVTGVHEEATEEEVTDKFADFGEIKNIHLNLDRRTGYVKGYALLEYETQSEASKAIAGCAAGLTLLEQPLQADFAFVRPPTRAANAGAATAGGAAPRAPRAQLESRDQRSGGSLAQRMNGSGTAAAPSSGAGGLRERMARSRSPERR
ncbi:hypothetical protein FA09DRAFT_310462 [Tilletiopsis washingtonensis]|uniref:RRM domain-containing protein n=1 Tax=Tilletiopsis washingtonensis TaxID=58919 RepID=A0A316Z4S0_9BASI|nr:hypothetical protein FA09DRAFT_310462 [Tilletiopsis washingtonensis]PWN96767.1 hypothetical protein FA09DRAFT_310462 [Tilletiopsis washingtonensis]